MTRRLTEKGLAEKLAGIYGDINDYDWAAVARKAAEELGVDLAPEPTPLPTEPGSIIIATEVRGVRAEWRMMLDRDGEWFSPEMICGEWHHQPEDITKWTKARVLPSATGPVELTEGQVVELHEAARLRNPAGGGVTPLRSLPGAVKAIHIATVNDALAQYAAPAEGEVIIPPRVRKGDRVRLMLTNGDEATVTVVSNADGYLVTKFNTFHLHTIRAVYLLHREDQP